jgi:Tol biopolymer transport system component
MANRLWWAACVLVGVIVLVELAAVALWLINHDPASQATTTTIQEAKRPELLDSGKFEGLSIGCTDSGQHQEAAGNEANQQEAKKEDPNGRIAFVAATGHTSGQELFTMNANGTERTRLTNLGMETQSPSWSPDGEKIVFWSRDESPKLFGDLWVINADGTGLRRLTHSPEELEISPAWSPNGEKISYSDGYNLYVMNADGTDHTHLTIGLTSAWSPNGKKIAYSQLGTPDSDIFVMNSNGTDITNLSKDYDLIESGPDWSPDGEKIAYEWGPAEDGDGVRGINVMNANGTRKITLVTNYYANSPSWSPDGEKIAYSANYGIYVRNANGSGKPMKLSHTGASEGDPDWSPCG